MYVNAITTVSTNECRDSDIYVCMYICTGEKRVKEVVDDGDVDVVVVE